MSAYTPCTCRDCFEIAVSEDPDKPEPCRACEEAGCDPGSECSNPDAYHAWDREGIRT